jgi:hypothetical protein
VRLSYYFAPTASTATRQTKETVRARSLRADVQRMIERRRHALHAAILSIS